MLAKEIPVDGFIQAEKNRKKRSKRLSPYEERERMRAEKLNETEAEKKVSKPRKSKIKKDKEVE